MASRKQAGAEDAAPQTAVAVPEKKSTGVVLGGYDAEDEGAGFEDFTLNDLLLPYLSVLQSGTPQVKAEKGDYVEGAKPGMFMNSVTNELFDGKVGIKIIPVHRKHHFMEWIPRDDGGGLVGDYSPNDPRILELRKASPFGKIVIEDGSIFKRDESDETEHSGNELVETFTVYVLVVREDGSFDPMVASFSSTAIKPYKKWMTTAFGIKIMTGDSSKPFIKPPLRAHIYRARTSFVEKNNYDWYSWQIGFENGTAEKSRLEKDSLLFTEATKLRDQVMSGQAKEDTSTILRTDAEEEGATTDKF